MIEVLKQALEALEYIDNVYMSVPKLGHEAITSLRQAIAELESQEPKCVVIIEVFGKDWRLEYMSLPVGKHKLYARQYLYTHPPQRTWQGLTHEQVDSWELPDCPTVFEFAQFIEAKLKQKNGFAEEKNT